MPSQDNVGDQARAGLFGALSSPNASAPGPVVSCERVWIEVQMLDESAAPVVGLACEVTAPDGTVHSGSTDKKGILRVEGVVPGNCTIGFPTLDRRTWNRA